MAALGKKISGKLGLGKEKEAKDKKEKKDKKRKEKVGIPLLEEKKTRDLHTCCLFSHTIIP